MTREATVERNTKETKIAIKLNLDGTGKTDIDTGIGFFDHMLNNFARHGLFDLTGKAKGELAGDRRGIFRSHVRWLYPSRTF